MPDTDAVTSSPPRPSGFSFRDIFSFEKMLTPYLVRGVFILGSIALILSGLTLIGLGVNARFGGGAQVFSGILMATLGPLFLRIACEQVLVLFGIYDRLGEIRDKS
jgi:hypothetical protein